MSVEIRIVQNKSDLREFIFLPSKLYSDRATWVPPLYMDEWKFYDPMAGGRLIRTETYFKGHLEKPGGDAAKAPTVTPDKNKKVEKTPEMIEWEKKNKGKKKVVRDGRTTGG